MKRLTFYIADVFAEKKYAGNQLARFSNIESSNIVANANRRVGEIRQSVAKWVSEQNR